MNIQINRAGVQRDSIPFNFRIGITFLIYLSAALKSVPRLVSSRNFSLALVSFSRIFSLSRGILKNVNNDVPSSFSFQPRDKKILKFLTRKSDLSNAQLGRLSAPDTRIGNPLWVSFSWIIQQRLMNIPPWKWMRKGTPLFGKNRRNHGEKSRFVIVFPLYISLRSFSLRVSSRNAWNKILIYLFSPISLPFLSHFPQDKNISLSFDFSIALRWKASQSCVSKNKVENKNWYKKHKRNERYFHIRDHRYAVNKRFTKSSPSFFPLNDRLMLKSWIRHKTQISSSPFPPLETKNGGRYREAEGRGRNYDQRMWRCLFMIHINRIVLHGLRYSYIAASVHYLACNVNTASRGAL